MIKKIGFFIMGILFMGIYIPLSLKVFSGSEQNIHYAQNGLMFGSYTLIGSFIFMTILLLIICNYLIDKIFIKTSKK
ncbi:hypothetical protein XM47_16915 [Catenovulum maritimum]|uniref:Uncharacterized protein n=1 Tax=Catenovulum maritimum TaxID=1513271 RepID=A0A0J8JHS7_9ALTE|nr:hypothetical protein XM47_16915 [Catenovulum maritimum]